MDYEWLKIRDREYEHWAVYLHQSQYYLGRCYIWCKNPEIVDLVADTAEIRDDLFAIALDVKIVLGRLFQPNLFNYCSLGNISRNCHLHIIPRYETPREFCGVTFTDDRWGKNYAPYPRDFKVGAEVLLTLRQEMASAM